MAQPDRGGRDRWRWVNGRDRYWHGWYQHDSGLWQEWHWDTLQSRWVEGPSPDAWYYQWTGSRGRTWEANNDWEMAEASDSADDDAPSAVAEVLWADPDDADAFELAETQEEVLAAINAVREEADAQRSAVAENPQDVAGQRFHGSLLDAAYDRLSTLTNRRLTTHCRRFQQRRLGMSPRAMHSSKLHGSGVRSLRNSRLWKGSTKRPQWRLPPRPPPQSRHVHA